MLWNLIILWAQKNNFFKYDSECHSELCLTLVVSCIIRIPSTMSDTLLCSSCKVTQCISTKWQTTSFIDWSHQIRRCSNLQGVCLCDCLSTPPARPPPFHGVHLETEPHRGRHQTPWSKLPVKESDAAKHKCGYEEQCCYKNFVLSMEHAYTMSISKKSNMLLLLKDHSYKEETG